MAYSLGRRIKGDTVVFAFSTYDITTGASITASSLTIGVYKNSDLTQRTAGITTTLDFDSQTGIHWISIDTNDAFYVSGEYTVVATALTVNSQTARAVLGHFEIGDDDFDTLATDIAAVQSTATTINNTVSAIAANQEIVCGSAVYNNKVLKCVFFLLRNGAIDTTTSNCSVSLYTRAGVLEQAFTQDTTPDAQGVFSIDVTLNTALSQFTVYYLKVTINNGAGGAGSNVVGIIPVIRFI